MDWISMQKSWERTGKKLFQRKFMDRKGLLTWYKQS